MSYLTLREVVNLTGITRRAIQGYEKAGLVSAAGKNERGCLLYDTKTLERIRRIKLFQKLGFSVKEIQRLIYLPKDKAQKEIMEKVKRLQERKTEIDLLIQEAEYLIESGRDG